MRQTLGIIGTGLEELSAADEEEDGAGENEAERFHEADFFTGENEDNGEFE